MRIAMIGTGYVGLVTGTCFAESGNDVTCVDIDPEKIAMLNRGQVPIYEPGLEKLVETSTKAGKLSFTTDLAGAVEAVSTVFIAVGTPQASDGRSDLSQVEATTKQIAKAANGLAPAQPRVPVPIDSLSKPAKSHVRNKELNRVRNRVILKPVMPSLPDKRKRRFARAAVRPCFQNHQTSQVKDHQENGLNFLFACILFPAPTGRER